MFKYRLVKAKDNLYLIQKKFLGFRWVTTKYSDNYTDAYLFFSRIESIDFKPEQILFESK